MIEHQLEIIFKNENMNLNKSNVNELENLKKCSIKISTQIIVLTPNSNSVL